MNVLSCGEEIMTRHSAVLIGCQRVTDRRTDGRTDVQTISITCFSIADGRKNRLIFDEVTAMSLVAPFLGHGALLFTGTAHIGYNTNTNFVECGLQVVEERFNMR